MSSLRSAVAAILLAGVAFAQDTGEAPPFPLVNDLPEGWETGGAPAPLDILGIQIGMPREAAQAAAMAGLSIDPAVDENRLSEMEIGISGEYGISVFFRYPASFTANKNGADGSQDFLMMNFTTAVSGERVSYVTRSLRWMGDQRPRLPDLVASVKEKYGEPSLADGFNSDTSTTFFWVYHKGEKVTYPAGTMRGGSAEPGSANNCLGLMSDIANPYQYDDQPQSMHTPRKAQEAMKDCAIVVEASISASNTPGLVDSLTVNMWGPRRIFENASATDKLLDEKLAEKLANDNPAPAAGPKL